MNYSTFNHLLQNISRLCYSSDLYNLSYKTCCAIDIHYYNYINSKQITYLNSKFDNDTLKNCVYFRNGLYIMMYILQCVFIYIVYKLFICYLNLNNLYKNIKTIKSDILDHFISIKQSEQEIEVIHLKYKKLVTNFDSADKINNILDKKYI